MLIDYNAVGLRVKIARIKTKITQEALAEKTGLSVAHVSNIETGNTKPSLSALVNIANILDVSVDELLCDNLIHANHVFVKEAQEILSDCPPYEIRILVDILKSAKDALRKDDKFREDLEKKKKFISIAK